MKTLAKIVGLGWLCGLGWYASSSALADLEIGASVQIHARTDFAAPLAVNGMWAEVRPYGRCWRPAGVSVNWRPYCDGSWVWTDCGWYWSSDEPWAWACYHYGTWALDPELGWVWIPDIEWSPAWVAWRVGGGYIGWAPCAPHGTVVAPRSYGFVATARFQERVRPASEVVNNMAIMNKTKALTDVKHVRRHIDGIQQNVVINEGPSVAAVQNASGIEIQAVPIREAISRARAIPRSADRLSSEGGPAGKQIETPQADPKRGGGLAPKPRPKEGRNTKHPSDHHESDGGHGGHEARRLQLRRPAGVRCPEALPGMSENWNVVKNVLPKSRFVYGICFVAALSHDLMDRARLHCDSCPQANPILL